MILQLTPCPASASQALCERIRKYAEEGSGAIDTRLEVLKREWTTGRCVKATCGLVLVAGLVLTLAVNPWWFMLLAVAGGTLLQYAFFRKSWLGELFALGGIRSGYQIDEERIVLRVLRGDMKCLPTLTQIVDREAIARMQDEGGPALDEDDDKFDVNEAAHAIAVGTANRP